MNDVVMKALRKAAEVRKLRNYTSYQPINIFDLCLNLDLTVRFIDINMEGMYVSQKDGSSPQILISNQRPFPRRVYTCAHELGHHLFEHGSRIDIVNDENSRHYDKDEYLVDTFAGAILMPVRAVLSEFAKRNWNINKTTPIQFYTIASTFGTGYRSLLTHCQKNNIIDSIAAKQLLKYTPGKIFENIYGSRLDKKHFKILDSLSAPSIVDLEVDNIIILPDNVRVEGSHLKKLKSITEGTSYITTSSGICRAYDEFKNEGYFIRIQQSGYIGLAEYRHLEI